MSRLHGNPQQVLWVFLLVLPTLVCTAPMHSQSTKANPDPDPKPAVNVNPQEPVQPLVVDPKTENSPPATPEQTRRAQIETDTKKLYQLSAELRAEVAKTYKESLSLTVLKKAEEVEKLAKNLKVLMMREAASRQ